jgi:hypothetical protein
VSELPTALHDLTQAMRYPRRTFDYCRMAAEVVRRYFDPPKVKPDQKRRRLGELAMCDALKIARDSLTALNAIAARSRHDELVSRSIGSCGSARLNLHGNWSPGSRIAFKAAPRAAIGSRSTFSSKVRSLRLHAISGTPDGYLARRFSPLQIGFELARCRDAAQRLVRTSWAQQRICQIANALLRRGSLNSEQIYELVC